MPVKSEYQPSSQSLFPLGQGDTCLPTILQRQHKTSCGRCYCSSIRVWLWKESFIAGSHQLSLWNVLVETLILLGRLSPVLQELGIPKPNWLSHTCILHWCYLQHNENTSHHLYEMMLGCWHTKFWKLLHEWYQSPHLFVVNSQLTSPSRDQRYHHSSFRLWICFPVKWNLLALVHPPS